MTTKPDLKRIASTLNELESKSTPAATAQSADWPRKSISMKVESFSTQKQPTKAPSLPKLKPPALSPQRHAANPALAMNLLKEIEEIVGKWQQELQQIVRQIQDLYLEGPIVDGWLDSHVQEEALDWEALKQVLDLSKAPSIHQLMNYVEEFTQQHSDTQVSYQSPRAGYRLCGLDENGQFWSKPCPPEQVPSVSVAIARYQKLRQLLNRKKELEARLGQLAETLVVLHGHLSAE